MGYANLRTRLNGIRESFPRHKFASTENDLVSTPVNMAVYPKNLWIIAVPQKTNPIGRSLVFFNCIPHHVAADTKDMVNSVKIAHHDRSVATGSLREL